MIPIGYWRSNPSGGLFERIATDAVGMFLEPRSRLPWRSVLAVVGELRERDLPWPADLIDVNWSPDERNKVLVHLHSGSVFRTELGQSPCRLCDLRQNGSQDLTDGVYVWPQGFAHYIEEHGVRPPSEFVSYVLRFHQW